MTDPIYTYGYQKSVRDGRDPRPKKVKRPEKQRWIEHRWGYRVKGKGTAFDASGSTKSPSHYCAVHLEAAARYRVRGHLVASYKAIRSSARTRAQEIEDRILSQRRVPKRLLKRVPLTGH